MTEACEQEVQPEVHGGLQRQNRGEQEPCHLRQCMGRQRDDDHEHRDNRRYALEEVVNEGCDREGGARELEGPNRRLRRLDQVDAVIDGRAGELEHEDADDDERSVIVHTSAHLEHNPEDQPIEGGVEARTQNEPE